MSTTLRLIAERQAEHLNTAARMTQAIHVNGKTQSLSDFTEALNALVQDSVGRIVEVSKQSIVMLYEIQAIERLLEEAKQHRPAPEPAKKGKKSEAPDHREEVARSLWEAITQRTERIKTLLAEVGSTDITANLITSEQITTMMKGFEAHQTKMHLALLEALRESKSIVSAA